MNEPFESPAPHRVSRAERARQRRAQRVPSGGDHGLVSPSGPGEVVLSALAGFLAGLGLRLDSQALLVAAILISPRLKPLYALAHQALRGSWPGMRAALGWLAALLGAFALASAIPLAVGAAPGTTSLVDRLARPDPYAYGLLLLGAILAGAGLASRQSLPLLPNIAVAYGLLLPVAASLASLFWGLEGGLGRGLLAVWLALSWALVGCWSAMIASGWRPAMSSRPRLIASLTVTLILALSSVVSLAAALLSASGPPPLAGEPPVLATPTSAPAPLATVQPTATATPSPAPSATPTTTATITPSPSPTASPTPVAALISTTDGVGAVLRAGPGGPIIGTVVEGATVQILGGPELVEGRNWWLVRTDAGLEGWILGRLIATATPSAP